ncbi:HAMP domain-containing histidine kinase [Streptomyces sp. NBC_00481]|uniref:sensor histidine kinase n=1 Tax=Streptomyces sp. NBC_00481 TaxID=2975755 RepID=UPI002DD7F64F|nr:HAMP domain-containing sensor histidine kinase [Streptomyces sp. NBC_00481]WRY94754.1 HAMP domain-containing histidine kinase [Streptomyces sp. NBC_00481]
MSLRPRFTLAFTAVGALVAVLVGVLSFRAASDRVVDGANRTVRLVALAVAEEQDTAQALPYAGTRDSDGHPGTGDEAEQPAIVRAVATDGTTTHLGGPDVALPVSDTGRALAASGAAGQEEATMIEVGGDTYCQLTIALGEGRGALQAAIPLEPTRDVLVGIAQEIAGAVLAVVLAAAGAGWLLARRITRPLVRLAGAAEEISADDHADREVPVDGRDEVARLSASFNTMLRRLAASRAARERLVQDAAHEVRNPLTSLTTNASVLRYVTELSPDDRDRLLDDVEDETRELGHLVDELIGLALSRSRDEAEEPVELAEVAGRAAQRLHRRTGRIVLLDADDRVVRGRRQALDRAVSNLLENAAKFDGDGEDPIEVHIRRGAITVSDRGPGIDAADAERVFDRFHRTDTAHGLPGSGLGLAIVRDVAQAHGGTVFARTRSGGGAAVGFTVAPSRLLPATEPDVAAAPQERG